MASSISIISISVFISRLYSCCGQVALGRASSLPHLPALSAQAARRTPCALESSCPEVSDPVSLLWNSGTAAELGHSPSLPLRVLAASGSPALQSARGAPLHTAIIHHTHGSAHSPSRTTWSSVTPWKCLTEVRKEWECLLFPYLPIHRPTVQFSPDYKESSGDAQPERQLGATCQGMSPLRPHTDRPWDLTGGCILMWDRILFLLHPPLSYSPLQVLHFRNAKLHQCWAGFPLGGLGMLQ